MRIACLHTAPSNVAVFESARAELGLGPTALLHEVRADLLAAAEAAGRLTDEIAIQAQAALRQLSLQQVDAVVLTCSTLGPVVSQADGDASGGPPVLRVDAALAAQAVRDGGPVVALCAVQTTLGPTRDLFQAAAAATGAQVQTRLVPGAWAAFKAGRGEDYLNLIAGAADEAFRAGAAVVALAQASMAGAAPLCRRGIPLCSPTAGLRAAQERVSR